jgi:hypothetical protein
MNSTTIGVIKQKTERFTREAAKLMTAIKPLYDDALNEAAKIKATLTQSCSPEEKHAVLRGIVEAAVSKLTADASAAKLEIYSMLISQFVNTYVLPMTSEPGRSTTPQQSTSGAYLIKRLACSLGFRGFTPDAQLRVLTAFILASQNRIDPGLIKITARWDTHLSFEEFERLARLADNAAVTKYLKTLADSAKVAAIAHSYHEALKQSEPKLYVPADNFMHAGKVSVRNHRGGTLRIKHVQFTGDGVTTLTPEEFTAIREHDFFQTHLKDGILEIVATEARVVQL